MFYQPNATLTFKIAQAGAVTRDSVTGRPSQPMQVIVVEASLEEARRPEEITIPGVDESSLFLKGRTINPQYLTDAMRVQKVVEMELNRGQNTKLKGKFYLMPTASSMLGLESFFGDQISGYFETEGNL